MTATLTPNHVTALPKSFNHTDTILAIFHLQGSVDAGYNTINSEIYDNLNIANYTRILGGKTNAEGVTLPDNGGQTAADLERLLHSAQEMPSLMFAMNGDVNSTEPLIVEHAKDGQESAYIVYLPFSIFKEAGISGTEDFVVVDDAGSHFVPKEETMKRYETLYPAMAEAAADFIQNNIENYQDKNIILDGNYIDAGQTVLHTQEKLKEDMQEGTVVSLYTPHTLGINKLNSLLKNALTNLEYRINESVAPAEVVEEIKAMPLLESYREMIDLMAAGTDPKVVSDAMRDYVENHEADDLNALDAAMKEAKFRPATIKNITNFLKSERLSAIVEEYASLERMTMESGENLKKFDGIMAVSQEMQQQVQDWTEGQVPNNFVLNGFNSEIFNPNVFDGVDNQAIIDRAVEIYKSAYAPSQKTDFEEQLYHDEIPVKSGNLDRMFNAFQDDILEQRTKGTTFIAASRPDERKGSDLTLDAFGEYVARTGDKDATLVLVSHKPDEPFSEMDVTLQNIIQRYDIGDQVLLLPQLQAQDIRTLYELPGAVGLAPSLNEPWGIVAIEQVGAGVPMIASSKYNAAKYVADQQDDTNRSIITFSSPSEKATKRADAVQQFADAMEEMNNNYDAYKANTQQWAEQIIEKFQWKATTDVYLDFSKELISKAQFEAKEAHNDNKLPTQTVSEPSKSEILQKTPTLGRTG